MATAVGSADEKKMIPSYQLQSRLTLHGQQVRCDVILINVWLTNGWSCRESGWGKPHYRLIKSLSGRMKLKLLIHTHCVFTWKCETTNMFLSKLISTAFFRNILQSRPTVTVGDIYNNHSEKINWTNTISTSTLGLKKIQNSSKNRNLTKE